MCVHARLVSFFLDFSRSKLQTLTFFKSSHVFKGSGFGSSLTAVKSEVLIYMS